MALIPLGTRVIVRQRTAEEKSDGGIIIPGSSKRKLNEGAVVSFGEGTPDNLKVGDSVVFTSYAGISVLDGNDELLVLDYSDILAVDR